jgi:long-chain acyl-CoA synthetase
LRRARRVALGREALVCGPTRLTYQAFLDRVGRLAGVLAAAGAAPGDRVAVLSGNSIPFLELYCAIPAAGRVQVPLNVRWAAPELAYALRDSGARLLFVDHDPGELGELVERVIRLDGGEYEELLGAAEPIDLWNGGGVAVSEDDLAGLFYTGGTTGASKGVMLTHRNLLANTFNNQMFLPLDGDDVYLVMAPLFHAAGSVSVLQTIFVGGRHVIVPTFEPGLVLDTMEREGVTATLGVPTMVAALVEEQLVRPRQLDRLRYISHGGSPIAVEVVRRAAKAFPGVELVHLYGATETAPILTGLRHEELALDTARAKSAGQAVVGVELVIRDPDGRPRPDGQPGEVTVRGANVMPGYWGKPEQTAGVLRDGWYWTGDVGRVDDEGYLFLLDRSKDMIISGGENVYCTEVEDVLYTHPLVLEATVFGVPHERWGEAVHAVVVPRPEAALGDETSGSVADQLAEELIEHCRTRIAGYKAPRSVEFRHEPLPKSGPGKILKRALRDRFWRDAPARTNAARAAREAK